MSTDLAPTGPLTEVESSTLARYEQVISDGLQTFVAVGTALTRIHDNALYRSTHDTFEAYCRERWSPSRSRAYQLMDTATAVRELSTMVDTPVPANERQAREVADLPAETAAQVMRAAAESGPVTARTIAAARREIAPKPAKPKVEPAVDLDTGEIVDLAERAGRAAADAADLPREPTIADAIREAKSRPSVAAYKVVERWRLAALSAKGIGGIDAVLADIDAGDLPAPDLAIWLRFIEESIAVADEWATAIRRRNLRSVK